MDLLHNLSINLYSILILVVIYFHSVKYDDKLSLNSKLYMLLVRITIILLLFDVMSRFDGHTNTIYPVINQTGNFFIFLLSPLLPSIWLIYVHVQLYNDEQRALRLVWPVTFINSAHWILVILSQYFGWFYTIDGANIYHRGPLFFLSTVISFSLLIIAASLVLFNRKKTRDRSYYSLVFFIIPPILSIFIQIYFYGTSLVLNSVVLSLLIIFLNIQNQSIFTDHLTGVYNRKMLEKYLKNKIGKCEEGKTFSAIMLDLNDFKTINDTYGHDMGDSALQTTARILRSTIKSNDFIARFGGDEFWLVLNTSNRNELKSMVNRINKNITKYNASGDFPYSLCFSMGYAVYDFRSNMKVDEFQKYIDMLMYENKQTRKRPFEVV